MPQYWLLLSSPESYHLDELFKKKLEVWDGVLGATAQKHIAAIKKGDRIRGYHTAPEESVHCGLRAARAPYQNPELKERNLVLDVALVKKLKRTVPQTELRKNPKLRRMKLSNSSAPSPSLP